MFTCEVKLKMNACQLNKYIKFYFLNHRLTAIISSGQSSANSPAESSNASLFQIDLVSFPFIKCNTRAVISLFFVIHL